MKRIHLPSPSRHFFTVVLSFFLVVFTAFDAFAQPGKRALLIGIDDYKSKHIPDLRGCGNDVELMRNILVGKFNIPSDNVTVLKNEQATHTGIVEAIQTQLIAKAQPDDVVILHYSGHGSQMKDNSGDEIDDLDETIVPHDSRTKGVFDISDDEINGLLQQLTAKTQHVTFILDSCHSGAAARGGAATREIATDERQPPPAADFAVSSREVGEGDAEFRLNGSKYVLISGCLADQLSNEGQFNDRRHGALTWFLAQALQAAGDASTYESIMDEVKRDVTMKYPTQKPQLEGLGTDLKVFGTETINSRPYVLVEHIEDGRVRLAGGAVYGLRQDAHLKVYPPKTSDFDQAQPIATVKIAQVNDYTSSAEVIDGSVTAPGSKAVLESIHFGNAAIPVFVDDPSSTKLKPIHAELVSMETQKLVQLVQDEGSAQFILRAGNGNVRVESPDLEVLVPPVSLSTPDYVDRVVNHLKDLVHWTSILELKNPKPNIKVDLQIHRESDPPTAPAPQEIPHDTPVTFTVTNKDEVDLYIYVLDISSDGGVYLLYPPRGEQQVLKRGKSLSETRKFFVPDGHNAVIDVIKVIATDHEINPGIFPKGPLRNTTRAGLAEFEDPLERLLAKATRGSRAPREEEELVKTWVTAQKGFTIRKPTVQVSGFSLHFTQSQTPESVQRTLGKPTRGECAPTKAGQLCLEELQPVSKDGTLFEAKGIQATRGAAKQAVSVGQAFQQAYELQDSTGAERVEPNLEIQMPRLETERGIEKRSIGEGETHDPIAEQDDVWSIKQIRAQVAWQKIREKYHRDEGAEAAGILIAHPDTGYRKHPEIWANSAAGRPLDVDKGHDYYDDDNDPEDPLLSSRPTDNPGHGTASGSVIVSPPDCQLTGTTKCVNGIARGAQLIPLRVHRTVAQLDTSKLSKAIRDVAKGNVDGKPKLMSIAMGGPPSYRLWKAVKKAEKNGVLIVAAAGNYVRTVVWPARFHSTIAAAAHNVGCQHWTHSSHGDAVDISAPGESVWRATLNAKHEYINGMGKGTTFATGNTAGAAALWLAWHGDQLEPLRAQGSVTKVFRRSLRASSWRPSTNPAENPPGTACEGDDWDPDYGPGMLDVAALLEQPLEEPGETRTIEDSSGELGDLPLFSSLYPAGTDPETIRNDYKSLFSETQNAEMNDVAKYETEILHHYTLNDEVQRSINSIVHSQRGGEPSKRVKAALRKQDLSPQLRGVLVP